MRRTRVIHPFLFALWPVLFLYSQNLDLISFSQIWPSSLILPALSLVMLLPFALILRSLMKAGAIVSLFLVLFFSYTHVYEMLWPEHASYAVTNQSLALMVTWSVLFAGGTALIVRITE